MSDDLVAPFPFFGGKALTAPLVWQALGDVKHYLEPFFGSGAVLLARPDYRQGEHVETVNDADGLLCNVWRALQTDPDAVARLCDWPVNHCDLSARKRAMIAAKGALTERLGADPDYYDARLAGYWVWAASCWIGSGLTSLGQIPHLGTGGMGVHKLGQIPHLGTGGMGVHKLGKIPHLSHGGKGVHRLGQRPIDAPETADVRDPYNTNIYAWFRRLSERLRYVRVVCGDWTRVCGGNWQDNMGIVGIFFDPPYGVSDRDDALYDIDSTTVAHDVREWCRARGRLPSYRIVLAGYEEHESLFDDGWTAHQYSVQGGYANIARTNKGANHNRHRETLYFSPHCLHTEVTAQMDMFGEETP